MKTNLNYTIQKFSIHEYENGISLNSDETNSDTANISTFRLYIYQNEINQIELVNTTPTFHHVSFTVPELVYPMWRPTLSLKRLLHEFETKILLDHPYIPSFPNMTLYLRQFASKPTKIAIYNSCKNLKTRKFPPILSARRSQENTDTTTSINNSNIPDIVIPNNAFPFETHDEDQRYNRLMVSCRLLKQKHVSRKHYPTRAELIGEPFFFQHLIMKIPCYSEEELIGTYSSYFKKFKSLFPNEYEQEINKLTNTTVTQELRNSNAYKEIIKKILTNLNNTEIYDLILKQLIMLECKTPSIDPHQTLLLNEDQYPIYDILCNS
ncbi:21549_t:CDS:2 [Cetraspora pellucida]|uniref:21549_t:CDS:1 n=1 Tax=Cetraspora pellucida TaxID=1433469 RepID=A0A9N9JAT2_9GLOM|nr:21549_t:CDS:2 [Cetraspora pellucida]